MSEPKSTRLTSWRNTYAKPHRAWNRLIATSLVLVSLGLYCYSLFQPRKDIHLWLLAPDSQCPLVDSVEIFTEDKIDFPNLMADSYARSVEAAVRGLANERNINRNRSSVANAKSELMEWSRRTHGNSTLVVYLSGVLSLGNGELGICDSSDDGLKNGQATLVSELVLWLRTIACTKVVLVVDAIAPESISSTHGIDEQWNRALRKIEMLLLDDDATPFALRLDLLLANRHEFRARESSFASQTIDILNGLLCRSDASQTLDEDGRTIKTQYRGKDEFIAGHIPSFLYSANWPIEFKSDESIVSRIKTRAMSSESASDTRTTDSSAKSISDIDESLARCKTTLQSWNETNEIKSTSVLRLEHGLSIADCFPNAAQSIADIFQQLWDVRKLNPEKVNAEFVQEFCDAVAKFPLSHDFSKLSTRKYLDGMRTLYPGIIQSQSSSLVTNLTLARIRLLDIDTVETQQDLLNQLWQHLQDPNDSSADLKTWVESLEDQNRFAEHTWIRHVLSLTEVDWVQQRSMIAARMLGDRLASDPMSTLYCKEYLRDGDQIRIEAERVISDRIESDWKKRSSSMLAECISRYQQGIEVLEKARVKHVEELQIPERDGGVAKKNLNDVIEELAQYNLNRLRSENVNATQFESEDIATRSRWWSKIASKPVTISSQDFHCVFDDRIDLTLSPKDQISIAMRSKSLEPITIQTRFDESALSIEWHDRKLQNARTVSLTPNPNGETLVNFTARRCQAFGKIEPIQLQITQGPTSKRNIIRVDAPAEPLVGLRVDSSVMDMSAQTYATKGEAGTYALTRLYLSPNRLNPINLSLHNRSRMGKTITCRVFLNPNGPCELPTGANTLEIAQRWMEQMPGLVHVGTSLPVTLEDEGSHSVFFVPPANAVERPSAGYDGIFLEIKDSESGYVQFEKVQPEIVDPKHYVRTSVVMNSEQQYVQLRAGFQNSKWIPKDGSNIVVQLRRLPDLEIVASTQFHLASNSPGAFQMERALTTVNCLGQKALLCWTIDDWPSNTVFELDLRKSGPCDVSSNAFYMRLRSLESSEFVATDRHELNLEIENHTNEEQLSNPREVVEVGIDRNNNRTLSDDAVVQLKNARNIGWSWSGISPSGFPLILSQIRWHRVVVPIETEWNHRGNAMASLRRNDEALYSNLKPFVFDKIEPKIASVRILQEVPCKLGENVQLAIQVDDHGLSGVCTVEAAWSTTGELDFAESSVRVPAIARDQDNWHITMPTNALPSGRTMLLVRASDRVGNVSRTRPVSIEILSASDLTARNSKFRTSITGKVLFVSQIQKNITVQLKPKSESDPKETNQPIEIASAKTDALGQFTLTDIPSGKYELEASGIVRGMRERNSQTIEVDAKSGPVQTIIRMDKKP